jgi:hypothetical protein
MKIPARRPSGPRGTYRKSFHGMVRSLASSRELGPSPMLQRLSSMRREIGHETVEHIVFSVMYSFTITKSATRQTSA